MGFSVSVDCFGVCYSQIAMKRSVLFTIWAVLLFIRETGPSAGISKHPKTSYFDLTQICHRLANLTLSELTCQQELVIFTDIIAAETVAIKALLS